jgi:hypothetical protein
VYFYENKGENMKRKVLSMSVAVALMFTSSGCRGGEPEPPTGGNAGNTQATTQANARETLQTEDFEYTRLTLSDELTVIVIDKYLGGEVNVIVPSEIGGYIVSFISAGAFADTDIVSVQIPDKVGISGEAFANCVSLVTVEIGSERAHIVEDAFLGCTSLSDESRQRILQVNPNAIFGVRDND